VSVSPGGLRARMSIAVLSVVAGLTALYLHLYKLGKVGPLVCASGEGCDRAMFSRFGWFMGVDVALIGVIGYLLLVVTALISLQSRWAGARWPATLLAVLGVGGFLFTVRLKYGEFVVLHTFCPWCAVSAVAITIIMVLALVEWNRIRKDSV
jgi:uncharacterized membrane protein